MAPLEPPSNTPPGRPGPRLALHSALLGLYFLIYHKAVTLSRVRLGAVPDESTPLYGGRRQYTGLAERLAALAWAMVPVALFVGMAWMIRRLLLSPRHRPILAISVLLAGVAGVNLTVGLAGRGGWPELCHAIDAPATHYYGDIDRVGDVASFLRDFPLTLPSLSLHSSTHPPGGAIFYHVLGDLAGRNHAAIYVAVLLFTALSVIGLYLVAWDLLGPRGAVIAGALYLVTPNLVLVAPSPDGVFAVFSVWAICCFHFALRRHWAWALPAGALLAMGMLMTYATTVTGLLLAVYALLDWIARRQTRFALLSLGACGLTFLLSLAMLWVATGFNIIDGLKAAMEKDARQMLKEGQTVLMWFNISVGNLFAFLIAVGLANVVLWWRDLVRMLRQGWRSCPGAPLVLAFTATLLLISFAKLFTLEVERIWVFLSPLVVLAAASSVRAHAQGQSPFAATMVAAGLLLAQTLLMKLFLNVG
jgi:hypothetical protein